MWPSGVERKMHLHRERASVRTLTRPVIRTGVSIIYTRTERGLSLAVASTGSATPTLYGLHSCFLGDSFDHNESLYFARAACTAMCTQKKLSTSPIAGLAA